MNDLLQQRFFRLLSECSQRKVSIIENDEFSQWMQKLYVKLEEVGKDIRILRNADKMLPEDNNLLDNQDLCLLFKVSIKPCNATGLSVCCCTSQSAEKCITGQLTR